MIGTAAVSSSGPHLLTLVALDFLTWVQPPDWNASISECWDEVHMILFSVTYYDLS